eukprot:SM000002S05486  [mRNA]  locus=s2:6046:9041:+ [translate_table: standard]
MDKVNMSVAVIPMSQQLGWSASTAGLVQSSFFWGYAASQLPGGWLAKRFSGARVLQAGVLAWSLATTAVPLVAPLLPALLATRLLVGLGEGVSPPAATDLIARTVPASERSRSVALVFGGLNVGSVLGLLIAPACIQAFGWESVFFIFGGLGFVWLLLSASVLSDRPQEAKAPAPSAGSPATTPLAAAPFGSCLPKSNGAAHQSTKPSQVASGTEMVSRAEVIPWRTFLASPVVWSIIYVHFCGNWGHYTLLSWLPTYFSDELKLDLTHAALVSILPPLVSVAASSVAAQLADSLISSGTNITLIAAEVTQVRKGCQSVAFLAPALYMGATAVFTGLHPWAIVAVLTTGIGLSSFSLAGLYCSHQDISPKYAGILLGMSNTVGAMPGVLGVALTGFLFDLTHSWALSLFFPSIFFYLTGLVVWLIFYSSKPQDFEAQHPVKEL